MPDAIGFLKEQHAEVGALLLKLQRTRDTVLRAGIFRSIDANLRVHAHLEEEIFYPAFRQAAGTEHQRIEVEESFAEHRQVKRTLEELETLDPAAAQFEEKIEMLKRLVRHHVAEEEHGMLRQAQRIFSEAELDALAHRMEMTAAMTSPVYEIRGPEMAVR